jgi:hypothetical protein
VKTAYETTPAVVETPGVLRRTRLASPRRCERVALAVVLLLTAVIYLWNITINGMGNKFYAGAAWAGSQNWTSLLFGSLDPRNFITVDKPPVSQWVMALSGQIFRFSSASRTATTTATAAQISEPRLEEAATPAGYLTWMNGSPTSGNGPTDRRQAVASSRR